MPVYMDYLNRQITLCRQNAEDASRTQRADEAGLWKIRANIYEICRTVYGVFSARQSPSDADRAYRNKLCSFRESWQSARDLAQEHNDSAQAATEEIKLEALADAMAAYEKWSAQQ